MEFDRVVLLLFKPVQIEVARKHFRTEEVANTKKFLASMEIGLPKRAVDEIGIIMTAKLSRECLIHDSFDSLGASMAPVFKFCCFE